MNLFDTNITLGLDDDTPISQDIQPKPIETPTAEFLMRNYKSAIGLDISKTGTGVSIWNGSEFELYGIQLENEIVQGDAYSELRLRMEFRDKLLEIVRGRHFELGVAENVFGGSNFYGVRTLLALNTVFDEISYTNLCTVDNYYKEINTEWKAYFRKLYNVHKKLNDKYEIEQILLYLNFKYAIENTNQRPKWKEDNHYQDKLDATGIILAKVMQLESKIVTPVKKKLSMRNVTVKFIEQLEDIEYTDDKVILNNRLKEVERVSFNIEKDILNYINQEDNNKVFIMKVENQYLGVFGSKYSIPLSPMGYIYLVFHKKNL